MNNKLIEVSKDKLFEVVRSCPHIYTTGVCAIGEPPIKQYFNFSTAEEVARIEYEWLGPNGEIEQVQGEYWKYYVKECL